MEGIPWSKGNTSESDLKETINFTDSLPPHQHIKEYGYNFQEIKYPVRRDRQKQIAWLARSNGIYDLPVSFVPEYSRELRCTHGNVYDGSENNLLLVSESVIVYSENHDKVYPIETYGRGTTNENGNLRPCKCIQQTDCDEYLLWHLGNGKMICYQTISNFMGHFWKGLSMLGSYEARIDSFENWLTNEPHISRLV